jgi:hypothetical protein
MEGCNLFQFSTRKTTPTLDFGEENDEITLFGVKLSNDNSDVDTSETKTTNQPNNTLTFDPFCSNAVMISNFVLPFSMQEVKRLLEKFGELKIWGMDPKRTTCWAIVREIFLFNSFISMKR